MSVTPKTYQYTVVGSYLFPFDMLRYDIAWPASESDSAVIEKTTRPRSPGPHRVNLSGLNEPTAARWKSFGWEVV